MRQDLRFKVEFKSFQFLIKLRFAVKISKAQDQSLKEMDIEMREEFFSRMRLAQNLVLQKVYTYWCPQENQQK
jgi:hypothetical protein